MLRHGSCITRLKETGYCEGILMMTVKRLLFAAFCLILLGGIALPIQSRAAAQSGSPTGEVKSAEIQPAEPAQAEPQQAGPITLAVESAVLTGKSEIPALKDSGAAIDYIAYSNDRSTALVYLALTDLQTGAILGTEPLLAVAHAAPELVNGWRITVQGDPLFLAELESLPAELLSKEIRQRFLEPGAEPKSPSATYGGYLLPWAAGLEKHLSMGANHVSCPSTCTYAFDFADGTMFPLLASKGGSVYYWKDTCNNFESSCTNSLTIEDRSTSPYTYQIYLHMAKNSIPTGLKQVGAAVVQGQYIGNVDDTGYSSGHHVHFMVVNQNTLYKSSQDYYWGYSVDITFRDVTVNWDSATQGGRPCKSSDLGYGKCVQAQYDYTSGNVGSNPPTGGLTGPAFGTTVTTQTVPVSGWGQDDLAVTKLQMLANYDGAWHEVGPGQTASPFSFNLDLCEDLIPDGPVTLALRVFDFEGNFTIQPLTPRPIYKSFTCSAPPPQPTCTVGTQQVAIFSETDFSGVCQVLGVGNYASGSLLGSVGGDNTASIKVGQDVSASLFWGEDFTRRSETFTSSYPNGALLDRNLADNLTSANTLSALKVQLRTDTPAAPVLNTDSSTSQLGTNPKSTDSIILSWTGGGGANKFKAQLYSGGVDGTLIKETSFLVDQSWSIGSLPAGSYTWQVQGRVANYSSNPTSYFGPWSTASFIVEPGSLQPQAPLPTPFSDTMEGGANGWTSTGLWRQASLPAGGGSTTAWVFNNGSDYADGSIRAGDLTSPPISLPASPAVRYLRFSYRTATESGQAYFDQRRVQVSVDDGAFQDLLLQGDDSRSAWLESGPISLVAYAGHTIRLRFHFNIIDSNWNNYAGWVVDNVSITDQAGSPAENPPSSTPATAVSLAYNSPYDAILSPEGDIDYYRITAAAGDVLRADVIAAGLNPPSPLDPTLALSDADGRSVLAENDDVAPGTNSDSRISYLIHSSGTYYLKVKAWNYPGTGGPSYRYRILVTQQADLTPPVAGLAYPPGGGYMPPATFELTASAADESGGSGVKQVSFYWHDPDWLNSWQLISTDANGADGWKAAFDPSGLIQGQLYSFYAKAEDWAGNQAGGIAWNVSIDTVAPVSALQSLPSSSGVTRFQLDWTGSDAASGLASFQLQYKVDGGAWLDYPVQFGGTERSMGFTGEIGKRYDFRLRAVDVAGNLEAYPASAETWTQISACSGDSLEDDDSLGTARLTSTDGALQGHTFCGASDEDWSAFDALPGVDYLVRTIPGTASQASAGIALFDSAGQPLPFTCAPSGYGSGCALRFTTAGAARVYVRIKNSDPVIAGNVVTYSLQVCPGRWWFLPIINK